MKIKKSTYVFVFGLFFCAIFFGAGLGLALSNTKFIKDNEQFTEFSTSLPTKLLDINGELITELASEEKREIISIRDLPQCMLDALITREDRLFYRHHGYSVKALFRAVFGKLTGMSLGGGSTLTQQIAGTLFCDRTDMSIRRKLKELWWAIQMERRYTKDEILELYLNKIYFGGGTYGVSAASKYYFGHDATEITPAEAAILVIQLSNPAFYNPFEYPNRAMDRQKDVLNTMVSAGYISKEQADESFDDYWADFDYTRTSTAAVFNHDDNAPWFSEYVRRELGNLIYGTEDIYSSGFTVNTTLNLKNQAVAQDVMDRYIRYANRTYQRSTGERTNQAFSVYTPMTELLALTFNLNGLKVSEQRNEAISKAAYTNQLNPVMDVMSLMFGIDSLKLGIVNKANQQAKVKVSKTTIEGTMIALENDTGYITSLVGGSKFDSENQFIRAVQAKIQPGSSFKPLYYSAAIDSRNFTPTTIISDTPVVFHTADGKPYIPQNFRGEWKGDVELWYALAHSMNIPSLKILDGIGFEAGINRAIALLGIPKEEVPYRGFVPGYPIGLGVCSVKPIELARAYSVFASGGKEVTPIAIRSVEDKNGNIILNPEKEVRTSLQAKGSSAQVITPQTAYVMTQLLQNTVRSGSLAGPSSNGTKFRYKDAKGRQYQIPAAGKTGTTQNWADAWAVGFTPYYTSVFWFGFDKPGQSLGLQLTGSTLSGYAWADYMKKVHNGLPMKEFSKPATGVIEATVCSVSGGILTPECGNHKVTAWYLEGTQPTQVCSVHSTANSSRTIGIYRLEKELYKAGFASELIIRDNSTLSFNLDKPLQSGDFGVFDTKLSPTDSQELDENGAAPNYNYLMD
ncbi:MAG: PBP1A family penicillin-binding protein [Treponema sp.]|uniref:penicillin-binding protein 1A n=1 Tax=Treponema sp. TaxID=166 RepID=UPI0025799BF5|nr:PBP1A family penicillin-binding protein [Treponema sp.]MBQ9103297.1 PBP1A family penicillin-binding protein [Treponema sp.]